MYFATITRTNMYQRTRLGLAVALSAFALTSAHADPDASTQSFRGSIAVAPVVATVGTLRTITVNATWPNACPPTFQSAAMEPGINPTTLILQFNVLATLVACAQVETAFTATTSFTPSRDGDFTVTAITNDDRVIAKGKMLTLPQGAPGAQNISGVWLGTFASSILMLTHSASASDAVVGSWNLFARDGSPHWQFIHSSRRTATNTFEAVLNEFTVPANSEACGNSACPVRGMTGREAGKLKFLLTKDDELTLELFSTPTSHPHLPVDTALFTTTLTRVKI